MGELARVRALCAELVAAAAAVQVEADRLGLGRPAAQLAPMPVVELLSVEEVATRLKLSPARVWELVGAGEVPSVRVGRARRVRSADLAGYVAALEG